jgi:DNA-binding response OmpR family regulator
MPVFNAPPLLPVASVAPDVVLVEGDVDLAAMITLALTASGYAVEVYHSGADALAALLAFPAHGSPRLVMLDADLVGVDGHTLHEQLELARPGAYGIVFLSTREGDAGQIRAYTAGALDYLVIPLSLPVLLAKVPLWLRRSASAE